MKFHPFDSPFGFFPLSALLPTLLIRHHCIYCQLFLFALSLATIGLLPKDLLPTRKCFSFDFGKFSAIGLFLFCVCFFYLFIVLMLFVWRENGHINVQIWGPLVSPLTFSTCLEWTYWCLDLWIFQAFCLLLRHYCICVVVSHFCYHCRQATTYVMLTKSIT